MSMIMTAARLRLTCLFACVAVTASARLSGEPAPFGEPAPSGAPQAATAQQAGSGPVASVAPDASSAVERAVRTAILERMGRTVEVRILSLDVPLPIVDVKTAVPDPAALLGKPLRVTLVGAGATRVNAVVSVAVVADYAVTRRALDRGATLTADDLSIVRGDVRGVPIRRLPDPAQLVGSRLLRPLAKEAVVPANAVAVRTLVTRGEPVTVVARAGGAEVTAEMTAAGSGNPGQLIRVVNAETRRAITGRVLADGRIEVTSAR